MNKFVCFVYNVRTYLCVCLYMLIAYVCVFIRVCKKIRLLILAEGLFCAFVLYSVMQSDGNSFCGDVVRQH